METIRGLFKDYDFINKRRKAGLGPEPTDAELECLAQTWSEHCKHKKFTGIWEYTSDDPNDESNLPPVTDNMLKSIIIDSTNKISQYIDYLVSVFV